MALSVSTVTREFNYNGSLLPDPNPSVSLADVQNIHAHSHPELTNAALDGPVTKGGRQVYTYHVAAGTKG